MTGFRPMRRKAQQLTDAESLDILQNATSGTLAVLGERYNPGDEAGLQKELELGFARMLAIRFDIEHLTGKQACELMQRHQA